MAGEKVQARIEQTPQPAAAPQAEQPRERDSAGREFHETPTSEKPVAEPGAWSRFSAWFSSTFPNSRHAVIGGACGLVVALLLFTIGVFKTVVIALLVTLGVACGQYADGDPKLVNLVRELMRRR